MCMCASFLQYMSGCVFSAGIKCHGAGKLAMCLILLLCFDIFYLFSCGTLIRYSQNKR